MHLSTQRPETLSVTIDGTSYELRDLNDMEFHELRDLRRRGAQMEELESIECPTPEQVKAYAALCFSVCATIVKAPTAVLESLRAADRHRLIHYYFEHTPPADVPHPIRQRHTHTH